MRISLTRMLTAIDSRERCPRALAARRSSAKSSQSAATGKASRSLILLVLLREGGGWPAGAQLCPQAVDLRLEIADLRVVALLCALETHSSARTCPRSPCLADLPRQPRAPSTHCSGDAGCGLRKPAAQPGTSDRRRSGARRDEHSIRIESSELRHPKQCPVPQWGGALGLSDYQCLLRASRA